VKSETRNVKMVRRRIRIELGRIKALSVRMRHRKQRPIAVM